MRCGLCGHLVGAAVVVLGLPGDSLVCEPCWHRWQWETWFPLAAAPQVRRRDPMFQGEQDG